MEGYRYSDKPPYSLLASVIIQAVIMGTINFSFLIVILRAANLSPQLIVVHEQWLMVAFFFTYLIQCLRFSRIGVGLFMPATSPAIYLAPGLVALSIGGFPLMVGMVMFASLCELCFSFFVRRLRVFLPPEISGLAFVIIGLQLCLVGFHLSFARVPMLSRVLFLLGFLAIIMGFSVWTKGVVKNLCPLYAGVIGVLFLFFAPGWFDFHWRALNYAQYAWVHYPSLLSFWPMHLAFDPRLIPLFLLTGFVATIRVVGVSIISCKYEYDSSRPKYPLLKKAVRGDAISCFFAAFFAGVGINVAPITTTLTIATRCTARFVSIGCAIIYITLAFSPKFMAFLVLMPNMLIGAMLFWYGVMLLGAGLRIMDSKSFEVQEFFAIGFGIIIVVTMLVYPNIYATMPHYLDEIIQQPLTSGLILAMLLTVILNIRRKKYVVTFDDQVCSSSEADVFTAKMLKSFKLDKSQKHYIEACIQEAIAKISEGYAESGIEVSIEQDKINLSVKLSYKGELISFSRHAKSHVFSLFDEQIVSSGLVGYFNILPDSFKQSKSKDRCCLLFGFDLT